MFKKLISNENFVWLLLIIITCLTWLLVDGDKSIAMVAMVIILSSLKVFLIGEAFMETYLANKVFVYFFYIWVMSVSLAIMIASFIPF